METKDKIVCIVHPSEWYNPCNTNTSIRPVKGEIYTIRNVVNVTSVVGFWLEEIINPTDSEGDEPWFDSRGFRPVDYKYGEDKINQLEEQFVQKEYLIEA